MLNEIAPEEWRQAILDANSSRKKGKCGLSLVNGQYFTVALLAAYLKDDYFLVAEDEGLLVGALVAEPLRNGGAMVWELAVEKERRGQGIGSVLLKKFIAIMKGKGRQWLILYAPSASPRTLAFYRRHRFCLGKKHIEALKNI